MTSHGSPLFGDESNSCAFNHARARRLYASARSSIASRSGTSRRSRLTHTSSGRGDCASSISSSNSCNHGGGGGGRSLGFFGATTTGSRFGSSVASLSHLSANNRQRDVNAQRSH